MENWGHTGGNTVTIDCAELDSAIEQFDVGVVMTGQKLNTDNLHVPK